MAFGGSQIIPPHREGSVRRGIILVGPAAVRINVRVGGRSWIIIVDGSTGGRSIVAVVVVVRRSIASDSTFSRTIKGQC